MVQISSSVAALHITCLLLTLREHQVLLGTWGNKKLQKHTKCLKLFMEVKIFLTDMCLNGLNIQRGT